MVSAAWASLLSPGAYSGGDAALGELRAAPTPVFLGDHRHPLLPGQGDGRGQAGDTRPNDQDIEFIACRGAARHVTRPRRENRYRSCAGQPGGPVGDGLVDLHLVDTLPQAVQQLWPGCSFS